MLATKNTLHHSNDHFSVNEKVKFFEKWSQLFPGINAGLYINADSQKSTPPIRDWPIEPPAPILESTAACSISPITPINLSNSRDNVFMSKFMI